MTVIGAFGIKYFAYILKIKMEYIVPTVLVFTLFGAYSLRNNVFDILIALVLGVVGAIFKKTGVPLAPIIIGVVLGGLIETNLVRSLTIANARQVSLLQYMLTNPLAIALLAMVCVIFYVVIKMRMKMKSM